MKPITRYSLSTGLTIKKPSIQEDYIVTDLDLEKTILIAAGDDNTSYTSKLYPYYGDVIDFLLPIVKPLGYSFAQIGMGEPPVANCKSFLGISPNQTAYLINRCALVFGNDNSNIQIASHFDKKLVALYGPTSPIDHAPSFGSKDNQILLSPNKPNWKPTYSPQENPKTIHLIKPEVVAQKVLDLLGINQQVIFETVSLGAAYPTVIMELVPNQVLPQQLFPNQPITIRMDYNFDEKILAQNLQQRKCNIITDKEINLNLIRQLKTNIFGINYQIDNTTNLDYCKQLKNSGARIVFFSEETGEELNKLRLKMLDISLVEQIEKEKKPLDWSETIGDTLFFKSNKFILSDGKIYLSKFDWFNNVPIESFSKNIGTVKDHPYYWESHQFNYVFKPKNVS